MTENDYITYTFRSLISFTSLGETYIKAVGEVMSEIRNTDYKNVVYRHRNAENRLKNNERRDVLRKEYGISSREADSIIYSNNDQLDFVKRTTKQNIDNWNYELRQIEKSIPFLKGTKKKIAYETKDKLLSKIKNAENKSPSCAFGGKKLQKEITQNPYNYNLREDWNNKRLFLYFMGNGGRNCGNDSVKIDPVTQEIMLSVSEGLRKLACLPSRKVVIGHACFKGKNKQVLSLIESKTCTTHNFVWDKNKRKFRLHSTSRLEKPTKKTGLTRHCGVDQNSGFITATIVDSAGNPICRNTFDHSHSKDIQSLVDKLTSWMEENECFSVSVEKLTNLHLRKRRSISSARVLNNTINKIPYGIFTSLLTRKMEKINGTFLKVSPHNTSKNAVFWKEDIFGTTTHEKASYLIARRGIGLKITRRVLKNNPVHNSVCEQEGLKNKSNTVIVTYHDVQQLC